MNTYTTIVLDSLGIPETVGVPHPSEYIAVSEALQVQAELNEFNTTYGANYMAVVVETETLEVQ